jgi:hypothetical protein
MLRFVVLAVFSLVVLASAPAQAAPVVPAAGVWSWVSEVWTGFFPAAPAHPPRRPFRGPDTRKAGGCVDPDGRTVTLCSTLESLPEPPLPTNG